jgi:hypothetical protein
MLFGPVMPETSLVASDDPGRRRLVGELVDAFAAIFTSIIYDVYWQSQTANAQAFCFLGARRVRLLGGLARHPGVSAAGLAWTLAHETGHHLGSGPAHPQVPQIRAEEAADAWAREIGLRTVFGDVHGRSYAEAGAAEMARFFVDPNNLCLNDPGDQGGG